MADILHSRWIRRFLIVLLAGNLGNLPASAQAPTLDDQLTQHLQALAAAHTAKSLKDQAFQLDSIAMLYAHDGQKLKAIEYFSQELPILRQLRNRASEASTLDNIGQFYSDLGQNQKAIGFFNQELPVRRAMQDSRGEATALDNMGQAWSAIGQKQKALAIFNQSLAIRHRIGDHNGEAAALGDLGSVYSDLGQKQKALDFFNRALPLCRENPPDRTVEATILDDIGQVYADEGQSEKALEFLNQALPIRRDPQVNDRAGEAATLDNIGSVYAATGQNQKALEFFKQALPIRHALGDSPGEAMTLDNIGGVYSDLNQFQKALEYFNQALTIRRQALDRNGEAQTLDNIGEAYSALGQNRQALEYFNKALPIQRAPQVKDRAGEAATLRDIGGAWADLGQPRKALGFYSLALPIEREVSSPAGEGYVLTRRARAEHALGETDNELRDELAARSLASSVGDLELRGEVDTLLMDGFRDRKRLQLAILFGTDAVNSYQQMRRAIAGLEKTLQAGFAQSKSDTYRELAELLVEAGRLGEAEQVLDLLKEQELKEIVRGSVAGNAARMEPLQLTAAQQKALDQLPVPEKTAAALTELTWQSAALQAKATRTPAEAAQLKALNARIEQGNASILAFFAGAIEMELEPEPGSAAPNAPPLAEDSKQSYLQNALAKLGPRVMGIRLLLGSQHSYAIVVTATTRKSIELRATPEELRAKALQAVEDLLTPSSDPKPHLAELYAMVVAPLEGELGSLEAPSASQASAPTLLWSLDGVLRYLPMAALYDGKRYLLERFDNILFTPESYVHMSDSPAIGAKASVLAMGLSKPYGGLPELPGVLPELDAVVHDPQVPASKGPMEGRLLADEQFTLAALNTELGPGRNVPVVHIASHFVLETGDGAEPYLLLAGEKDGDKRGFAWTLADMQSSPVAFHGTRLLTLSACSTAKDYTSKDGLEMDSLGMIAQQKDAESVLATLWDVNDASTSRLMSDFYRRWVAHPADGKAEALRQAQLAFLHPPSEQEAEYAHPFYWAPFVLMGNYR